MLINKLFTTKDTGLRNTTRTSIASCGRYCISAACVSNIGKRRSNNEDNFYFYRQFLDCDNNGTDDILIYNSEIGANEGLAFAVFDGMGGGDYGEVASYVASRTTDFYFQSDELSSNENVDKYLRKLCSEINDNVLSKSTELNCYYMGTTLVMILVSEEKTWVCNIGDSKCMLLRDGKLEQISRDHTDEKEMLVNGITGRKPYLTQYLGMDPLEIVIEPYICEQETRPGDVLLLSSDGLTDMVDKEIIEEILLSNDEPAFSVQKLVDIALENGGRDNITVIEVRVK